MLEVSVSEDRTGRTITRTIDSRGSTDPVFFRFEGEVLPPPLSNGNIAVLAMLPLAMAREEPLHVRAGVDRLLLENLEEYQSAWTKWRPDLFARVDILVDEEIDERTTSPHEDDRTAVASFSGGVDASFLVVANAQRLLGRRSRDLVAGVMVHGYDIPLDDASGFASAVLHGKAILERWTIPLTTVATNWLLVACPHWEMTFALGFAAVLHQFAPAVRVAQLASDMPYTHFPSYPWGSNLMTDFLLSSSGMRMQRFGADYGRNDRCRAIGAFPEVLEHVRVCWEGPVPGQNCGQCEKCVRTKLNFLVAGFDDVSALGGPITVEQVESIAPKNLLQHRLLIDIDTDSGADAIPPEIRSALRRVVDRYDAS